MKPEIAIERISSALGYPIAHFMQYSDGFSFTTETELQAYKAAYDYQGPHNKLVVRYAPNVNRWSVKLWNHK